MELPLQFILTTLSSVMVAMGATFIALKISNAENRKDIDHIIEMVKDNAEAIKETERHLLKHTNSDSHVSLANIRTLEQRILDMAKSDEIAHNRIETKLDKFEARMEKVMDRLK